jgi:hypothetical protein
LLRGNIVITGNDANGDLADLTDAQMSRLINSEPTGREEWILGWRFSHDMRAKRREFRSIPTTGVRRQWADLLCEAMS